MPSYIKPNNPPTQALAQANETGLLITLSNRIKVQWEKSKIHKSIIHNNGNYIIQYGDEPTGKFETEDKSIITSLLKIHPNYGFQIPKKPSLFRSATGFVFIILFIILFLIGFFFSFSVFLNNSIVDSSIIFSLMGFTAYKIYHHSILQDY